MIIQSTRVYLEELWVSAQLEIENGKILTIWPYNTKTVDKDYGDARILPGFIDTHCHGAFAFDTNDADEEGLRRWVKQIPQEGVTSICPTTITQSEEVLTKALKKVAEVAAKKPEGANIVGIHLEGPYLCSLYKGAQPEKYIVMPDIDQFKRYYDASKGLLKIMTMAVENDKNYDFIKEVKKMGVAINIGHSGASYAESLFALANGANGFTHTFNGMSPFNHREPNLAGAAMQIRDGYAEIITDGIHVSWPVVNLLFRAKGKDHVVMITDALQAKGVGEGRYVFGGQEIDIKANGGAYLANSNSLAGSTLRFNKSLKNVIELAGVEEVSAINACTINPAKVLHMDDVKGRLRSGYDADIVVLDRDYEVIETYVLGQSVYLKK